MQGDPSQDPIPPPPAYYDSIIFIKNIQNMVILFILVCYYVYVYLQIRLNLDLAGLLSLSLYLLVAIVRVAIGLIKNKDDLGLDPIFNLI
jgi:hypothetical protein